MIGDGATEGGSSCLDVLGRGLREDVDRLRRADPVVREGIDTEGVHKARVASRRLRSQLRSFRGAIEKDEGDELRRRLSWFADLLGEVRDLDVLAERLEKSAPDLSGEERRPVLSQLHIERQKAFAELILAMSSKRFGALSSRLDRLAATPPVRRRQRDLPATEVLVSPAASAFRRFEEAVDRLAPLASDRELHRVRIFAKRARYAAELVRPVAPDGVAKVAKRAAGVQKALGELSDGARAVAWLEGLKTRSWAPVELTAGSDPLVAVEALLSAEHAALKEVRTSWFGSFVRAKEAAAAVGWSTPPAASEESGAPPSELGGLYPFTVSV